jgi:iron complex transport system ATP-binding protein
MDLRAENVSFDFKHKSVLRDVSFVTKAGTLTVVIGPNAVGKSTLLKCLMGILRVRAKGLVSLDGRSIAELTLREMARYVGYLPQEKASATLLTVFETILLGRRVSLTSGLRSLRVPPEEADRVWRIMKETHIDGIAARLLHQLSGGQRKIVSIAQIIVREPRVLLLDEPTANLDIQNQMEIMELTRKYTRQRQIATVLTLHDLNIAARFADQVVVLKEGRVHCAGTPETIFTKEVMEEVYGVDVELLHDSKGIPVIIPVGSGSNRTASVREA